MNLPAVRNAIHVGDKVFHDGSKVEENLFEDIMKSVKPWVEDILNAGYKVSASKDNLFFINGRFSYRELLLIKNYLIYRAAPSEQSLQ